MSSVRVHVYDLSMGMARQLGPALIGRSLEGIWHTAVVVYGVEYYFSGFGVETAIPGKTHYGTPVRVDDMGWTDVPQSLFHEFIQGLHGEFGPGCYHLLDRNCNHFSDRACEFLVGRGIAPEIVSLPSDLINTPMGQMMRPFIEQIMGPSKIPSVTPSPFSSHGLTSPPTSAPSTPAAPVPTVTTAEPAADEVHLADVADFIPPLRDNAALDAFLAQSPAAIVFVTDTRQAPCNALNGAFVEAAMGGSVSCAYCDAADGPIPSHLQGIKAPSFVEFRNGARAAVLEAPSPADVYERLAAFLSAAEPVSLNA